MKKYPHIVEITVNDDEEHLYDEIRAWMNTHTRVWMLTVDENYGWWKRPEIKRWTYKAHFKRVRDAVLFKVVWG